MQQGQQYKFSKYLGNNLSEELYNKSKEVIKFTTDELQDKITYYSEQIKNFL